MQQNHYLEEMGILSWELEHPDRLSGYEGQKITLPESCSLLLVSPVKPEGELVVMFEKVLKSLGLELFQSMHIFPAQLSRLGEHKVEWFWFAGCDGSATDDVNTLTSPELSSIRGNNEERRKLWQQICSYDQNN